MLEMNQLKPHLASFYQLPTLELAKRLLGSILIKETAEGTAAGLIVETEAYMGTIDQAAHSFNHKRTNRTEIMFGPPGYAYTYQMHTHCLFNVVSGPVEQPEAVLIRAVEPVFNTPLIEERRSKIKKVVDRTNGPGKLTKALGITMGDYGHELTSAPLLIAKGLNDQPEISTGPRIGIPNAGEATNYPWRFWITGNAYVSKMR
ncbi:putative 3-methyladenine DNA glycosylase [Paraliobacillus ryukyuensis]|uniref:Putative 3-methyladenine DNA glycosylase n=2 Tax=Paraliobacillus ryukyuensis TaxID=200904 RepID=A0A366EDJ8_9BACI|nr:DNA-3-methyladenine glycosylase [Paraliobacillus ryukyuensis]RBO99819.1 DNA-3-methyladenine glycosylase [Paraliobacillus ryukyuensis]